MQSVHDHRSGPDDRSSNAVPAPEIGSDRHWIAGRDPLSEVLATVRLRGVLFFLWEVSSPFVTPVPSGRRFAPVLLPGAQQIVSYHVVVEGGCWGGVPGGPPMRLDTGDVLLVPRGDAYVIASSETGWCSSEVDDRPTFEFFRAMAAGELPFVVEDGGGGPDRARLLCGFLGCDLRPFNPVVEALPEVVRLAAPDGPGGRRFRSLVEYAVVEAREPSPGSGSTLVRLSELMFVEVVRRCLPGLPGSSRGWMAGLRDPLVGRCLEAMHRGPAEGWTLGRLAAVAGCSRSSLAERFSDVLGEPPMRYLTRWRMQLASTLLDDPAMTVEAVALRVGYASAAAFSRAFSRVVGASPGGWRASRLRLVGATPPDGTRAACRIVECPRGGASSRAEE